MVNLAHNTLDKLKGVKMPALNRAKVTKFFYDYFLCLDEDEMASLQKPKVNDKK